MSVYNMAKVMGTGDCIRNLKGLVKDVHVGEDILNDEQDFIFEYNYKAQNY
jgi:hypothetical protein